MGKLSSITFENALKLAGGLSQNRPTLLLGNGFGIAYHADIFSYKALFHSVDWSDASRVPRVFEQLGTWDFEVAIRNIEIAADIAGVYQAGNGILSESMRSDANFLKQALIRAIQATHPAQLRSIRLEWVELPIFCVILVGSSR